MTGENLDYLKMFMNLLSSRSPNTDDAPAEFQIDDTYSVPGIAELLYPPSHFFSDFLIIFWGDIFPVTCVPTTTFLIIGVGTVVSGTTLRGTVKLNDTLLLGPDALGHFHPIAIKSIHRKR